MDAYELAERFYTVLALLVLPIASCVPFCLKRTGRAGSVWLAPFICIALLLGLDFLFHPYRLTDLIELATTSECDFTTLYWLYLFVPLQFAISLAVTAGAYLFLSKRGRRNAN